MQLATLQAVAAHESETKGESKMNTVKHVNNLWATLVDTINATTNASEAGRALIDCRGNSNYNHALQNLLDEETANERQHRRGFGTGAYLVSSVVAAKIIIMENVARGAAKSEILPASLWLTIRRLPAEWRDAAGKLDYSELMNPK